jgi:uncharacterized protein YjbI with pentapeptide repeats
LGEQYEIQDSLLKRPGYYDKEAWKAYWEYLGQPWRTEPEIKNERQEYLAERRKRKPNIEYGIYPFKEIDPKLSRADIEWLLATHDNNRGPVDWSDESQRKRKGLDLRGADLRDVDLRGLPLARMIAEQVQSTTGQRYEAKTFYFHQIDIFAVHLEGANLSEAHLEGSSMLNAHLESANLKLGNLKGAFLLDAHLEGADLYYAHLEDVKFKEAHLEGADLRQASLKGADLRQAHLDHAILNEAHLEGASLNFAHLEGADLSSAFFDSETNLEKIALNSNEDDSASVCDIHWGDVNIAVVDWKTLSILGDENRAKRYKNKTSGYEIAARAYRQLSIVLRNQGLEDAPRFAYRAHLMQRKVFWYKHKLLSYFGSLFLGLISGYGYKVGRCFIVYAIMIGVFALIYHSLGTHPGWIESFVISMTAFHGRGFFPNQFHPGDPQAIAAAFEAFLGLLIEITLIATFTQRFFGR